MNNYLVQKSEVLLFLNNCADRPHQISEFNDVMFIIFHLNPYQFSTSKTSHCQVFESKLQKDAAHSHGPNY